MSTLEKMKEFDRFEIEDGGAITITLTSKTKVVDLVKADTFHGFENEEFILPDYLLLEHYV